MRGLQSALGEQPTDLLGINPADGALLIATHSGFDRVDKNLRKADAPSAVASSLRTLVVEDGVWRFSRV